MMSDAEFARAAEQLGAAEGISTKGGMKGSLKGGKGMGGAKGFGKKGSSSGKERNPVI